MRNPMERDIEMRKNFSARRMYRHEVIRDVWRMCQHSPCFFSTFFCSMCVSPLSGFRFRMRRIFRRVISVVFYSLHAGTDCELIWCTFCSVIVIQT